MAIELDTIVKQAAGFWGKLSKPRRLLLVAAVLVVLGGAAFFSLYTPPEKWAVLAWNVREEAAGQLIAQLKSMNEPYRIGANGKTIEVPEARVHELKMMLASAGSSAPVGFEMFDKADYAGTTDRMELLKIQRALSGELARTISTLDPVESARVQLAMKQPSLYAKNEQPPSASVTLTLKPGRSLTPAQVKGIVNLVSRSVEGLDPEHIVMNDETGASLWSGTDETTAGDVQHDLERTLRQRVLSLTESIAGRGHAVVEVTAVIDTTQRERTEETYSKDASVPHSQSESTERSGNLGPTGPGGVTGSTGNLPGAQNATSSSTQQPLAAGVQREITQGSEKTQRTVNFDNGRKVERVIDGRPRVARVHVAVLIDAARLLPTPAKEVPPPPAPVKTSTVPTSTVATATPAATPAAKPAVPAIVKEPAKPRFTLAEVKDLLSAAAGLDLARGDRIEVHAIPFAVDEEEKQIAAAPAPSILERVPIKIEYLAAGAGALVLVGAAIAGVVVVRRRRKKAAEEIVPEVLTAQPLLPITAGQMESALEGKPHDQPEPLQLPAMTPREKAIEAVRTDAARAARVLAAWLAEPVEAPVEAEGGSSR